MSTQKAMMSHLISFGRQILVAVALAALFLSCSGFGPQGSLVTSTKVGIYATENAGSKYGTSCAFSILGLIALGDGSIETAAANGGVSTIKSIDLESFSILFFYARLCTVVRGD